VKIIILLLSLCFALYSQSVSGKASEFIDKKKLESSKNLISFLFSKDEKKYYDKNGKINTVSILKTLRDNALLELSFKEPQDLELVFITKQNPLIFMRVISESLNSMGYNLFMTKKVSKTPEEFIWRISLSTQNIPSPILLSEALKIHGCEVLDITRDGSTWSYDIDSQNAYIDTIKVAQNKKTYLKKPFAAYLVALNGDTKSITLEAHAADHWYPKVSFYGSNMHLISTYELDKRQSVLKLRVPQKAAYVKIDDKYMLDNIKRGLSITIE